MRCAFNLENPHCELALGEQFTEVLKHFKDFPLDYINENNYVVAHKVTSLGGAKHELGLHFAEQKLVSLEMFFFNLEHIETDDEFKYIQDQLVKIYGKPTASALQNGRYSQNQWIFGNSFQLTNNQSQEFGHSINFGSYAGFTLTDDGLWQPRS